MTYVSRSRVDERACLNRPVWHALMTRQKHLSVSDGEAVMFRPQVSHFGATGLQSEGDLLGFSSLVARSYEGVVLMQTDDFVPPDALRCTRRAEGLQMVLEKPPTQRVAPAFCVLGYADVPEMLRLVELTVPGPFRLKTGTLGVYLGVRHQGRLIAMAGERLKPPGFTEISAVCVHPEHRGKGLAKALVSALVDLITSRNETPMLHLYSDNHPARALYEGLGFQMHAMINIVTVESVRVSDNLDGK